MNSILCLWFNLVWCWARHSCISNLANRYFKYF